MKSTIKILLFNLFLTTTLIAQDDEFGIASYYSDLFQGKPTASGELYDKAQLTAAHKTLPFGTLVKVTRLDNNKSVQVRVNDRGPFISGRIIEISREGASRIDLIRDGATRVKVEIVKEKSADAVAENTPKIVPVPAEQPEAKIEKKVEPKTVEKSTPTVKSPVAATPAAKGKVKVNEKPGKKSTPAATPKSYDEVASTSVLVKGQDYTPVGLYEIELKRPEAKGYGVQVAALTSQNALFKKIADLQGNWFSSIMVNVEQGKKDEMVYKVILGSFTTQGEADVYKSNLKKNKKIDGFVVDLASFAPSK